MKVTYMLVVSVVTYILGAINRAFFETLPNRFFPIQNVVIGLISGFVCYFANIETNLFNSIVVCLVAAEAAGGVSDLFQTNKDTTISAVGDSSEVYDELEHYDKNE